MPTSFPTEPAEPPRSLMALVFILAFFAAIFAIEIIDPAPMDVNAAWVVSS